MQTVLVMIFHTDAIIVRIGNSIEKVISEIYGHKWLVKNVNLSWIDFNVFACHCFPV